MMTLQKVKQRIRDGKYAWPGGYPVYFIAEDGGAICIDCVKKNWKRVVAAHLMKNDKSWGILGADINYEDDMLLCENCSENIESAYGEN
jgi:hypothetical protein